MKEREIQDSYNSSDSQWNLQVSESPDHISCPACCGHEENATLKCLHCNQYSCLECDEDIMWDTVTATEQGMMFFNMPRKIEAYNIASLLFVVLVILFLFIR